MNTSKPSFVSAQKDTFSSFPFAISVCGKIVAKLVTINIDSLFYLVKLLWNKIQNCFCNYEKHTRQITITENSLKQGKSFIRAIINRDNHLSN